MKAARYADSYRQPFEGTLAFLCDYAEEYHWPPVQQLSVFHLEEYFVWFGERPLWFGERRNEASKPSVAYIDVQQRRLHRFFKFVVERGFIATNPMAFVKRPPLEKRVVPTLTDSQVVDLLDSVDPKDGHTEEQRFRRYRDRAIIYLLWDTPGRRAEISSLTIDNIDLDENIITVIGKGNKERQMPLGKVASEMLWEYMAVRNEVAKDPVRELWVDSKGKGLSRPGWLYLNLKRIGRRAGIPNLHTHRFRHTYAMNWLRTGAPERTLQASGGWQKIPETYFRTLSVEDVSRVHQEVSAPDRVMKGVRGSRKPRGKL